VDVHRKAVEQADGLVALTMKRLSEVFAQERTKPEQQWIGGAKSPRGSARCFAAVSGFLPPPTVHLIGCDSF